MRKIFFCILIALFVFTVCEESQTEWTDPVSGTKYDFTSLKRDPK
jgi:hypothetical protein